MFQKPVQETPHSLTPAVPPSDPIARDGPAPAAPASSETAARGQAASGASVLGPDLAIRGGIEGRGEIQLQGRAWGDVKVERLLVGEAAELEGSVIANLVEVRGRVTGSIEASSVRLLPSAKVEGDITYEVLQIEPGALFEGRCVKAKPKAGSVTAGSPPLPAPSAPSGVSRISETGPTKS